MTTPTPATVVVPVELIRTKIQEYEDGGWPVAASEWRALLPKPTPRLVAFNFDDWCHASGRDFKSYLAAQPDLLTLIDEVIDRKPRFLISGGLHGDRSYVEPSDVKARIRAALGVTQ